MKENKEQKHTQFYRKFNDICNELESININNILNDEEAFKTGNTYELFYYAKLLSLTMDMPVNNVTFLLHRKIFEDLSVLEFSKNNNFLEDNYFLYHIALSNRYPTNIEKEKLAKHLKLPKMIITKRCKGDDFFLYPYYDSMEGLTDLIEEKERKNYHMLGLNAHFYLTFFSRFFHIVNANAASNDLLFSVRKYNKKVYKEAKKIETKQIEEIIDTPLYKKISKFNDKYVNFLNKTLTNEIDFNKKNMINITNNIMNLIKFYLLGEYKGIVSLSKGYIENMSISMQFLNKEVKEGEELFAKFVVAYSTSLSTKIDDPNLKKVSDQFKDVLFKEVSSNRDKMLYCFHNKNITLTDLANDLIDGNEEIFEIYSKSCKLIHSVGQLIKYKDDFKVLSEKFIIFYIDKTIELFNNFLSRNVDTKKPNGVKTIAENEKMMDLLMNFKDKFIKQCD